VQPQQRSATGSPRRRRANKTKWALTVVSVGSTVGLMSQMGPFTAAGASDAETVASAPPVPAAVTPASEDDAAPPAGLPMVVATGPPPAEFGSTTSSLPQGPRRYVAGAGSVGEHPEATTTTTTAAPRPRPTAPPTTQPSAPAPTTTVPAPPPPPPPPTTDSSG